MSSLLIQHAKDNVWCSPNQDRQMIIEPARIGPAHGVMGRVEIHWQTIPLPETPAGEPRNYNVFILGPLSPWSVNLTEEVERWIPVTEIMRDNNVDIHFYTKTGRQMPRHALWLRRLRDNTYILAMRTYNVLGLNLDDPEDKLYFRVYSNSYFDSARWLLGPYSQYPNLRPIEVGGGRLGHNGYTYGMFYAQMASIPHSTIGSTLVFKNGYLVQPSLLQAQLKTGDIVEFVHDRSIKRIETHPLSELPSFTSTLDNKPKYILYPEEDVGNTIDYHDDVDFYLTRTSWEGRSVGVYYHRNSGDAVRMLTHNSYSLVEQYIDGFLNADTAVNIDYSEPGWVNTPIHAVVMIVRHSGWERPLVHEHNRIDELYKLDRENTLSAMTGVDSLVDEWRAENLEASMYTKIMRSKGDEITLDMVASAYGYNATSKITAPVDAPIKRYQNTRYAEKPPMMRKVSAFAYDSNGKLVDVVSHNTGTNIIHFPDAPSVGATHANAELMEGELLRNRGRTYYGYTSVTNGLPLNEQGFRCYICPIVDDVPNEKWQEVTEEDNYFTISEDGLTVIWDEELISTANMYPATRLGNVVIWLDEIPIPSQYSGLLRFSIAATNTWKYPSITSAAADMYREETIPYGGLDIFMDGESLIEGIDYFVQWPQVVVTRRLPRLPSEGLDIKVRCYGFCKSDMSHSLVRDIGFVNHGMLSDNSRYDVRNDRNIRIVVGGKYMPRKDVVFIEDLPTPEEKSKVPVLPEGAPYCISDVVQPIDHILKRDTFDFYELSASVDTKVQEYLDLHGPDIPSPTPAVTNALWKLYDPFISKIIHDLTNTSWLGNGELVGEYTADDIDEWLVDHLYLLDYDPILKGVDLRYIHVGAHSSMHPIEVSVEQYAFLERVITLYLNGKIDLTPYVILRTEENG